MQNPDRIKLNGVAGVNHERNVRAIKALKTLYNKILNDAEQLVHFRGYGMNKVFIPKRKIIQPEFNLKDKPVDIEKIAYSTSKYSKPKGFKKSPNGLNNNHLASSEKVEKRKRIYSALSKMLMALTKKPRKMKEPDEGPQMPLFSSKNMIFHRDAKNMTIDRNHRIIFFNEDDNFLPFYEKNNFLANIKETDSEQNVRDYDSQEQYTKNITEYKRAVKDQPLKHLLSSKMENDPSGIPHGTEFPFSNLGKVEDSIVCTESNSRNDKKKRMSCKQFFKEDNYENFKNPIVKRFYDYSKFPSSYCTSSTGFYDLSMTKSPLEVKICRNSPRIFSNARKRSLRGINNFFEARNANANIYYRKRVSNRGRNNPLSYTNNSQVNDRYALNTQKIHNDNMYKTETKSDSLKRNMLNTHGHLNPLKSFEEKLNSKMRPGMSSYFGDAKTFYSSEHLSKEKNMSNLLSQKVKSNLRSSNQHCRGTTAKEQKGYDILDEEYESIDYDSRDESSTPVSLDPENLIVVPDDENENEKTSSSFQYNNQQNENNLQKDFIDQYPRKITTQSVKPFFEESSKRNEINFKIKNLNNKNSGLIFVTTRHPVRRITKNSCELHQFYAQCSPEINTSPTSRMEFVTLGTRKTTSLKHEELGRGIGTEQIGTRENEVVPICSTSHDEEEDDEDDEEYTEVEFRTTTDNNDMNIFLNDLCSSSSGTEMNCTTTLGPVLEDSSSSLKTTKCPTSSNGKIILKRSTISPKTTIKALSERKQQAVKFRDVYEFINGRTLRPVTTSSIQYHPPFSRFLKKLIPKFNTRGKGNFTTGKSKINYDKFKVPKTKSYNSSDDVNLLRQEINSNSSMRGMNGSTIKMESTNSLDLRKKVKKTHKFEKRDVKQILSGISANEPTGQNNLMNYQKMKSKLVRCIDDINDTIEDEYYEDDYDYSEPSPKPSTDNGYTKKEEMHQPFNEMSSQKPFNYKLTSFDAGSSKGDFRTTKLGSRNKERLKTVHTKQRMLAECGSENFDNYKGTVHVNYEGNLKRNNKLFMKAGLLKPTIAAKFKYFTPDQLLQQKYVTELSKKNKIVVKARPPGAKIGQVIVDGNRGKKLSLMNRNRVKSWVIEPTIVATTFSGVSIGENVGGCESNLNYKTDSQEIKKSFTHTMDNEILYMTTDNQIESENKSRIKKKYHMTGDKKDVDSVTPNGIYDSLTADYGDSEFNLGLNNKLVKSSQEILKTSDNDYATPDNNHEPLEMDYDDYLYAFNNNRIEVNTEEVTHSDRLDSIVSVVKEMGTLKKILSSVGSKGSVLGSLRRNGNQRLTYKNSDQSNQMSEATSGNFERQRVNETIDVANYRKSVFDAIIKCVTGELSISNAPLPKSEENLPATSMSTLSSLGHFLCSEYSSTTVSNSNNTSQILTTLSACTMKSTECTSYDIKTTSTIPYTTVLTKTLPSSSTCLDHKNITTTSGVAYNFTRLLSTIISDLPVILTACDTSRQSTTSTVFTQSTTTGTILPQSTNVTQPSSLSTIISTSDLSKQYTTLSTTPCGTTDLTKGSLTTCDNPVPSQTKPPKRRTNTSCVPSNHVNSTVSENKVTSTQTSSEITKQESSTDACDIPGICYDILCNKGVASRKPISFDDRIKELRKFCTLSLDVSERKTKSHSGKLNHRMAGKKRFLKSELAKEISKKKLLENNALKNGKTKSMHLMNDSNEVIILVNDCCRGRENPFSSKLDQDYKQGGASLSTLKYPIFFANFEKKTTCKD